MKPYEVRFYVYAENEEQVRELEKAAYEFVSEKYKSGLLVTARKLTQALRSFGDNYFVNRFLK